MPDLIDDLVLRWKQDPSAKATVALCDALRDSPRGPLVQEVGELATALRLLGETTPTIMSWNLHRNGLAAWLLFQKTLEECRDLGAAALGPLFDNLRLYYRRYWHVPSAEFAIR